MINFFKPEYFLVAAEELNFTKAAKKLFISQQSLSNHISNMEKEFDVILFNRTTPLTLTYAGQALKAKARQMLELRDETYRELSDIKDFSVGQLTWDSPHPRTRHPAGNLTGIQRAVSKHRLKAGGGQFLRAG